MVAMGMRATSLFCIDEFLPEDKAAIQLEACVEGTESGVNGLKESQPPSSPCDKDTNSRIVCTSSL